MRCRYKKTMASFVVLFLLGILIGWIGFPSFLKSMIKKQVVLKPGGETRKLWSKVPFPIDFLIYVFNVTNPDEVQAGGKPILKEIGPYLFDEWKDKYDLEDNEEDDTVTYHMRNTFIFRPDKSNGLTGDEIITIPHPIIQPVSVLIKRDKQPMMPIVSGGLKIIFGEESAFLTGKFIDIFFNGIPIDCSSDNFNAKAICVAFHTEEVKGGKKYNETHFAFSLFGGANATDAGKFTVYRGVKNSHDVGRVIEFDDEPELSVWDGDECNQFVGTDSTIFPPLMKKEEGLWAFAADLCRSLGGYYERKSSYNGIPTLRYGMDFGDLKNEEHNHCFCDDPPDGCPPKGTMDLHRCVGGPMLVSLPHFYKADPALLDNIIGLNPNEHDHAIYIDFEIISGSPLNAAKRLQFNLDVEPVEEVPQMRNIRKMIIPLFWVEESAKLNETFTNMIKNTLFLGLKVNNGIKWGFTIIGLIGMSITIYVNYQKEQAEKFITRPVNSTKTASTPDEYTSEEPYSNETEKY